MVSDKLAINSTNHQNQWLSRTNPHDTITTYKVEKHNYIVNSDTPDASLYQNCKKFQNLSNPREQKDWSTDKKKKKNCQNIQHGRYTAHANEPESGKSHKHDSEGKNKWTKSNMVEIEVA